MICMSNIFLDYEEVKQQIQQQVAEAKKQEIAVLQDQLKKCHERIDDLRKQLDKKSDT